MQMQTFIFCIFAKNKFFMRNFVGVVTDVCVAFPALAALEVGYDVFVVVDASGTLNKDVRDAALMRVLHAGAQISI